MVKGIEKFREAFSAFSDNYVIIGGTVELGNYIAGSGIDYWIYGHSHTNIDAKIGNTQCLSNQLGYTFSNEHHHFSPNKHIAI